MIGSCCAWKGIVAWMLIIVVVNSIGNITGVKLVKEVVFKDDPEGMCSNELENPHCLGKVGHNGSYLYHV